MLHSHQQNDSRFNTDSEESCLDVPLERMWSVWQTCLVYAIGVENYIFEAQTTHLRLHYTNYANDFVSATRYRQV